MPLLNKARLFANRALAPAGLTIAKVKKRNPWKAFETVSVGKFTIQAFGKSDLAAIYSETPDNMRGLGVLAGLLKSKYPKLSAIDVGANVGDTACIIKTTADIPIMCIEGDDSTFELLQRNIRQFRNVTAHKIFLGEKTETINASVSNEGWNTTLKPGESSEAHAIRISSFDDFISIEPPPEKCKLMKIDAEGFDCRIIRGSVKFIRQSRPAILFEYNRDNMDVMGEKGLTTLSMLKEIGYSKVVFHDCGGRFFTSTDLSNSGLIKDLLDYADGKCGLIYYFDLTVFHQDDEDVATEFINCEREGRKHPAE